MSEEPSPKPSIVFQLAKASWVAPVVGGIGYGMYSQGPSALQKNILLGVFLGLSILGFGFGLSAILLNLRRKEPGVAKHAVAGIGCGSFLLIPALMGIGMALLGASKKDVLVETPSRFLAEGRFQDAADHLSPRLSRIPEGTESRLEATAFGLLGFAQKGMGANADAEVSLTRSKNALERVGLGEHAGELEPVLDQLGELAIQRQDLMVADAHLTRAWEIHRAAGSSYALTPNNLAIVRFAQGKHDEALSLQAEALLLAEKNPGDGRNVRLFRVNYIDMLRMKGDETGARKKEAEWGLVGTPGIPP